MAAQRRIGLIFLVVIAGLVVGSLLGEILGSLLPAGRSQDFISRGPTIGLNPPVTIDLRFLAMTFGLSLKINLMGVAGVVLAALALRGLEGRSRRAHILSGTNRQRRLSRHQPGAVDDHQRPQRDSSDREYDQ